jgi:primase-polymerase (primpol)-like protein
MFAALNVECTRIEGIKMSELIDGITKGDIVRRGGERYECKGLYADCYIFSHIPSHVIRWVSSEVLHEYTKENSCSECKRPL